jgi:hypothetical protein
MNEMTDDELRIEFEALVDRGWPQKALGVGRMAFERLAARNQQIERVRKIVRDHENYPVIAKGLIADAVDLTSPESQSPVERNLLDALEACNQQVQGVERLLDACTEVMGPDGDVSIFSVREALARPESQPPARCQQISIGRQCKLEPRHEQDHEFEPLPPAEKIQWCDALLDDGSRCPRERKACPEHRPPPHEIDNGEAQSKARAVATEARDKAANALIAFRVGGRDLDTLATNALLFVDAILAAAREGVK